MVDRNTSSTSSERSEDARSLSHPSSITILPHSFLAVQIDPPLPRPIVCFVFSHLPSQSEDLTHACGPLIPASLLDAGTLLSTGLFPGIGRTCCLSPMRPSMKGSAECAFYSDEISDRNMSALDFSV